MVKFSFHRWRFGFIAERPLLFLHPANRFRGGFGKALHEIAEPSEYARIFAPKSEAGPSGLADRPRPFVLRLTGLPDRVPAGREFTMIVHYFDVRRPALHLFTDAFTKFGTTMRASLQRVDEDPVELRLERPSELVRAIKVEFLTPTELKPGGCSFDVLFGRARDRVSTLSAVYGEGPLDIDFRDTGELAKLVGTRKSTLHSVTEMRRSASTGQTHSIGGFVGEAVYEGDLAEFVPVLEAAQYTGVGRQTVWGKGEISVTPLIE